MNTKGNTQKTSVTRDEERWEVEVAAEIPPESLHQHRESAVHELQKTTKMDGFRPGKVPREKIVEMYGEEAIMRRAAERAIQAEIPELFAKEGLFIIETPKVTIDAPLPGKGLSFKARAGLAPSIELPDYTAIAEEHRKKKEVPAVTDAEYEEALLHLRRERVRIDKMESGIDAQKAAEEARAFPTADLPALDESFAQSVGYESAEKFLQAVRSNMQKEKEMREAQMKRNVLLDDLVKHSTIHYPVVMREYEINDLEARLSEDLAQAGMSLDHYLTEVKKTREALRKDWEASADTRVKVRLLLSEIARREKIEPAPEVVTHELEHAIAHYPGVDSEQLRPSVVHALRNEMTLRFLEGNTDSLAHDHEHEEE